MKKDSVIITEMTNNTATTRKNEALAIGQTILNQIGRWNLAAFGVPRSSIMALSENEFRLGGIMLKFTNCPKIRSGIVIIELMPSDTYTVSILSPLKIVLAKQDNVHCDQLFAYLDGQIG